MTNNRIWVMGGVLVIVAVLALAVLLGVKPQLDAAQASRSERESVEQLNAQKTAELASLKEEFTHLDEVAAQVAELRKAVPSTPDLDTLTGQLAAMQAATGVTITSYTPSDPTVFTPAADIAAQVPPTIDATRFVTIPVTISISGTRKADLAFVNALQTGERLFLVTSVTISPDNNGVTSTSITGITYVLLDQPLVDPAVAAAAAAAATATPTG